MRVFLDYGRKRWKSSKHWKPETEDVVIAAHNTFLEQRLGFLPSRFSEDLHTKEIASSLHFFRNGEDPRSWASVLTNLLKNLGGLPIIALGAFMLKYSTSPEQAFIAGITTALGLLWQSRALVAWITGRRK